MMESQQNISSIQEITASMPYNQADQVAEKSLSDNNYSIKFVIDNNLNYIDGKVLTNSILLSNLAIIPIEAKSEFVKALQSQTKNLLVNQHQQQQQPSCEQKHETYNDSSNSSNSISNSIINNNSNSFLKLRSLLNNDIKSESHSECGPVSKKLKIDDTISINNSDVPATGDSLKNQ